MKQSVSEEDSWFDKHVSSSFLFITGFCIAPTIILQHNLFIKFYQILVFAVISYILKQRIILLGSFVFFISTVVLNLFSPLGKVLVKIGPFPITEGSLNSGLSKALTIIGLMYLSRFSVRSNLNLPGRFGSCISKTLFYLNCLVEEKKSISRKDIVGSLDALFEKVYNNKKYNPAIRFGKTSMYGVILLLALLLLNWGLVFYSLKMKPF